MPLVYGVVLASRTVSFGHGVDVSLSGFVYFVLAYGASSETVSDFGQRRVFFGDPYYAVVPVYAYDVSETALAFVHGMPLAVWVEVFGPVSPEYAAFFA